ncbi:Sec-independent protein translocase protein TatB [Elioraea sp.]|uniref:Sec-independent protein translocase protein TatB n=1 Tax=Elioraea sp. TaxID=2185103 RepID=UPI0025B9F5DE|nr:Sec-independent protein translocase protein TatB [Elioraea sp.]
MFDLAWSEIALILLIALVVIGPKELPNAVRGIADFIRKARRMAGEFQVHVDEMMRETKLDEVKKQIDEVRSGIYDMKRDVERSVDENGIRDAFKDPFNETATSTTTSTMTPASATTAPAEAASGPAPPQPAPPAPPPPLAKGPPAFVPPTVAAPQAAVASPRDSA